MAVRLRIIRNVFSYGHKRNYEMSRPVIGIMGNFYLINDQYPVHASGTMNCEAIVDLCDATPLIIPGDPRFVSVDELMRVCDGFLFTGGRPNAVNSPNHSTLYMITQTIPLAFLAFGSTRDLSEPSTSGTLWL